MYIKCIANGKLLYNTGCSARCEGGSKGRGHMFRTIILQLKINLKKEWVIKRPTELEGLTYE